MFLLFGRFTSHTQIFKNLVENLYFSTRLCSLYQYFGLAFVKSLSAFHDQGDLSPEHTFTVEPAIDSFPAINALINIFLPDHEELLHIFKNLVENLYISTRLCSFYKYFELPFVKSLAAFHEQGNLSPEHSFTVEPAIDSFPLVDYIDVFGSFST